MNDMFKAFRTKTAREAIQDHVERHHMTLKDFAETAYGKQFGCRIPRGALEKDVVDLRQTESTRPLPTYLTDYLQGKRSVPKRGGWF